LSTKKLGIKWSNYWAEKRRKSIRLNYTR
jgi:hypothetical protein